MWRGICEAGGKGSGCGLRVAGCGGKEKSITAGIPRRGAILAVGMCVRDLPGCRMGRAYCGRGRMNARAGLVGCGSGWAAQALERDSKIFFQKTAISACAPRSGGGRLHYVSG